MATDCELCGKKGAGLPAHTRDVAVITSKRVFVAIGLFASSVTDIQLVALAMSFSLSLTLWIIGWFGAALGESSLGTILGHISMLSHFDTMSGGVVHINDVVYFSSTILFFLFATTQRVEAPRGR